MHSHTQLEWIQENRAKKDRVRTVGDAVEQLVSRVVESRDIAAMRKAAEVLSGLVDNEFRRHCHVAAADNGKLAIHVDNPALVYPMRLRWSIPLRDALSRAGRLAPGARVVFEQGMAGIALSRSTTTETPASTAPVSGWGRYGGWPRRTVD